MTVFINSNSTVGTAQQVWAVDVAVWQMHSSCIRHASSSVLVCTRLSQPNLQAVILLLQVGLRTACEALLQEASKLAATVHCHCSAQQQAAATACSMHSQQQQQHTQGQCMVQTATVAGAASGALFSDFIWLTANCTCYLHLPALTASSCLCASMCSCMPACLLHNKPLWPDVCSYQQAGVYAAGGSGTH